MKNPLLNHLNERITSHLDISREREVLQKAVIEKRFADVEASMKKLNTLLEKEGSAC